MIMRHINSLTMTLCRTLSYSVHVRRTNISLGQCRRNEFESGGRAPVRRKSGGTDSAQSTGKLFLVVLLRCFGSKSTLSRFGERFRGGQYSLVSFLFAFLYPGAPVSIHFKKWGARVPVPYGVGATGLRHRSIT